MWTWREHPRSGVVYIVVAYNDGAILAVMNPEGPIPLLADRSIRRT